MGNVVGVELRKLGMPEDVRGKGFLFSGIAATHVGNAELCFEGVFIGTGIFTMPVEANWPKGKIAHVEATLFLIDAVGNVFSQKVVEYPRQAFSVEKWKVIVAVSKMTFEGTIEIVS